MNWLLLTFLAVGSRSVMSIGTKVLSTQTKVSSTTQTVLFTGGAALLSFLASPWLGGLTTHGLDSLWHIALLMIIAQALGNILFFKGLAELEASVASVAFSSILPWGLILSVIFLGSSFSLKQSAGIVLLFIAILLVQYKKGVKRIDPAVLYVAGSAFSFAVFQVASAELSKTVPAATYLVFTYFGSTALVWLAYRQKVTRELRSLSSQLRQVSQVVWLASLSSFGYFVFSYFAYRQAPDRGVVVLLLTSQVVFSVILGIIFLKEHKNIPRKLGAGALALAASLLIKS